MSFPTTVAIVGIIRAPHKTRVAEIGSVKVTVSAGTLDVRECSGRRKEN